MKKVHIRKHRKVFICSPFRPRGVTAGQRAKDLRHNRQLAKLACGYAVSLGYMPLAPHLFFPEFLSEDVPEEREAGIRFGLEWLSGCDELWVIGNRITEGMKCEIAVARNWVSRSSSTSRVWCWKATCWMHSLAESLLSLIPATRKMTGIPMKMMKRRA